MAKAASQRSLDSWTKQKWRTKSGKPSTQGPKATGERYLPEAAIKAMSSSQYAASTAKKRKDKAAGKQFSKQPKGAAKTSKRYRRVQLVIDFDVDGDGKITPEEIAMKERMLEVELREEKAESQKFMAWVAMGMMIVFTVILFTPLMTDTRVSALADLLGLFYIAQTGVVAAYMGATAYMAGKPMGNKVAMKKDMR